MPPSEKCIGVISDEKKNECILKLRRLMMDDENLKQLQTDDEYLSRFLNATKYEVEAAFKKMKTFYELLLEYPDWFTRSSPLEKKKIIDKDIRIITGEYDKEGRPIYIVKIGNMDSSTMDVVKDVVAIDDFYAEFLLASNPSQCSEKGLCILIDINNFSLNLMKWLTPHNIRTAIKRVQSMPIREFKYHVINSSLTIQIAIRVIWPFLPQSIKDAVSFHFNDWESLYKHIDQDVLPEEYGGTKHQNYHMYHLQIYNKNSEISNSFKINREIYAKTVKKSNKKNKS